MQAISLEGLHYVILFPLGTMALMALVGIIKMAFFTMPEILSELKIIREKLAVIEERQRNGV